MNIIITFINVIKIAEYPKRSGKIQENTSFNTFRWWDLVRVVPCFGVTSHNYVYIESTSFWNTIV